jgi:hypothetical protein
MAFSPLPQKGSSYARDGHKLGDLPKRTSIGNGKRKRGSFKGAKAYRGQGKK